MSGERVVRMFLLKLGPHTLRLFHLVQVSKRSTSTFSKPFNAGSDKHPEKMRQQRETLEHPFGK
jgi:hypothetical protein